MKISSIDWLTKVRALDQLDRWAFHQGLDLLSLGPRQADDYIGSLRLSGRSPGSIRLDMAGPSAFFTYLERRFEVVSNPFRGTKARPAYRPSRPFGDQSATRLSDRVRRHIERLAQRGAVGAVYSAKDIYRLKELLGHSDLRNTERYLKSLQVL